MSSAINEWFYFGKDTINKKTCNKIKRLGQSKWELASVDSQKSTTDEERKTGRKGEFAVDKKIRESLVSWHNDQWLYDLIWPYMVRANDEAGWKYNITAGETVQITKYKKGGFYNFHKDGSQDHLSAYDNPENNWTHGKVRKLSMSIMLNENFEGGSFEFASYAKEDCTVTPINAERGSVLVFPSWMEHRVAPITTGVRYSLVCWFVGTPFL